MTSPKITEATVHTKNNGQTDQKEDLLMTLVSSANARESAPAQTKDRIKHQVKVHWKNNINQRKQRRRWLVCGSFATAMSLLLVVLFSDSVLHTSSPANFVYLENSQGQVKTNPIVIQTGSTDSVDNGSRELVGGTVIETLEDGYATLTMTTGANLRIGHNTQLVIDDYNQFTLKFGRVYFDSGSDNLTRTSISISTHHGIIQNIGTQFEVVTNQDKIQVSVREGLVHINSDIGKSVLPKGLQITRQTGLGDITKQITAHDPMWNWVNNLSPHFDLEGKSMHQFLVWIAREHGLTLSFKDTRTERLSTVIMLHGDIKDLTLEQTLSSVLLTTELRYMVDDNQLKVFR
jgi:hypothetical protein